MFEVNDLPSRWKAHFEWKSHPAPAINSKSIVASLYTAVSGDSKWSDLSFSQKITGEIKMKIEIIIRSICNPMQFSTMTYKEQGQLIAESFMMSAI